MSQSHIPQPNATPAAPAETYSSTDEAPHGSTISKIQTPGPPPQEIPAHTTAFNGLDPMLYQQYMYCDSFTWSTSDNRGKLLWYKPVHPKSIHKIMDRLCTIYNAWGGSMNIQFKVAGTGFHAGALAFVKIPPNMDPGQFGATFDWTVFPYEVIDVKTLECDALQAGDQRQVAYHYTIGETNDPKSWDHGGWIACYVYLGLNTAPSGTQQVQIMITAKPGQDFMFSQMKMPSIADDIKLDTLPPGLQYLTEQVFDQLPTGIGILEYMTALPISIAQTAMHSYVVVRHDTGEWYDEDAVACFKQRSKWTAQSRIRMLTQYALNVTSNTTDQVATHLAGNSLTSWDSPYAIVYKWNIVAPKDTKSWSFDVTAAKFNVSGTSSTVQITTSVKPPDDMPASTQYMAAGPSSNFSTAQGLKNFAPPISESILLFSVTGYNGTTQGAIPQPPDFARHAVTAPFMRPDQCALFVLSDSENLPIMYIKMYPEGWFTTNARKDSYQFKLANNKLKFQNYISRTTDLPANTPQMAMNFKMSALSERKLARMSERSH